MEDNNSKALSAALSQIEKQFGKGSIMKMGDGSINEDLQVISTGSLGLDVMSCGRWCWATGRRTCSGTPPCCWPMAWPASGPPAG